MLRQIRLLTKVSLLGMWGINKFRFTKDKGRKIRYYLGGFLGILLIVMMAGYTGALSWGLTAMGIGRLVPAVLAMAVSMIVFLFTLFKAGPVLFDWKSYEKQIAMPVSVRAVIVSRFLTMYLIDMLLGFLVLLPGMAVYGWMERPGFSFYLYGGLVGIFLPLLPLTAASVLGALIAGISSRWKYKNLVTIVLSLVLVCVILVGSMGMSGMDESELLSVMQEVGEMAEGQIRKTYPPAIWIADAMVRGNVGKFLLFLGVSMGFFALFLEILQRFYVSICMLLNAREAKGNYRMERLQEKSVLSAMVERELRHYFSCSVYVVNTLVGELLMVLMAAAILFLDMESVEAMLGLQGTVRKSLPFLMGFLPAMMPLTSSSISLEGKQWWMLQTLPVSRKDMIRSKVAVKLLVALPFYLVSEALLFAALRPGWAEGVSLLAVPAVYILFSARAGLAVNEWLPVFDWESEVRVVKQSASVIVSMLVGMVAAFVPLAVLVLFPGISAYAVYIVTAVLLLAAACVIPKRQG